jgi:hypothetical protein
MAEHTVRPLAKAGRRARAMRRGRQSCWRGGRCNSSSRPRSGLIHRSHDRHLPRRHRDSADHGGHASPPPFFFLRARLHPKRVVASPRWGAAWSARSLAQTRRWGRCSRSRTGESSASGAAMGDSQPRRRIASPGLGTGGSMARAGGRPRVGPTRREIWDGSKGGEQTFH